MGKAPESTEDHIHTVAAKREELLSILAATEHAKASLTRAKLNVAALKGPWYDSDALCSDLNARKIDIRKEYEDLRDSHVRKLFGGSKFQESLKEKEEDLAEVEEWYEKADQARVEPKKKLDEAKKVRDELEKLVEDHLQAQIGLEELYASVFDGPSPANAEEDALELELNKFQDVSDIQAIRYGTLAATDLRCSCRYSTPSKPM
jgi:chromosome segregation ATPase